MQEERSLRHRGLGAARLYRESRSLGRSLACPERSRGSGNIVSLMLSTASGGWAAVPEDAMSEEMPSPLRRDHRQTQVYSQTWKIRARPPLASTPVQETRVGQSASPTRLQRKA